MNSYTEQVTIRGHETDILGLLRVKSLCDFLVNAANAHSRYLDIDVYALRRENLTWMLRRMKLQVNRLPRESEMIIITTCPSGTNRVFAYRDFVVTNPIGETLARAVTEWLVVNTKKRRPARLPVEILRIPSSSSKLVTDMPFTLDLPSNNENDIFRVPFVATYDTIDFNGHVTQSSYVGWAINALPFGFFRHHAIKDIELLYEHEILPDSTIDSLYSISELPDITRVTHYIANPDGAIIHCLAASTWRRVD